MSTPRGAARMVDVSGQGGHRSAGRSPPAGCETTAEVVDLLRRDGLPKGDALAVARLAGIMGAKRTPDLIPLCHPIALHGVTVDLQTRRRRRRHHRDRQDRRPHGRGDGGADRGGRRRARADRHGQGGRPGRRRSTVRVLRKEGGKTGLWVRPMTDPGAGDRRVQPGRRRGLRRHQRPAARRRPARARLRGRRRRSWCPTASRSGRACGRRSPTASTWSLTSGGTGITPTDRTPDVTRALLDYEIPGIAEAIRAHSRDQPCPPRRCPGAWPASPAARWSSTCPARRGGARDGLAVLGPILGHAVDQLRGGDH